MGFSVGKIGMLYFCLSIHTYKIFCLLFKIGYLRKAGILLAKFAHFFSFLLTFYATKFVENVAKNIDFGLFNPSTM